MKWDRKLENWLFPTCYFRVIFSGHKLRKWFYPIWGTCRGRADVLIFTQKKGLQMITEAIFCCCARGIWGRSQKEILLHVIQTPALFSGLMLMLEKDRQREKREESWLKNRKRSKSTFTEPNWVKASGESSGVLKASEAIPIWPSSTSTGM